MPGKSPTELLELIADTRREVAVLATKADGIEKDVGRIEHVVILQRLAILEAHVADLRKAKDVDDGRRWQFWLGVGTVTLTFVANLTVNLLLYFARR